MGNETVVVTRHQALVALLVERGIIGEGTPVLSHVTDPEQIAGKDVIGVLPFELASWARSVTVVPLALEPGDRGRELSIERLREIAGEARAYRVTGDMPVPTVRQVLIGREAHIDHGLSADHLAWLISQCEAHWEEWGLGEGVVVRTLEPPRHLSALECALWGPAMGDPPVGDHAVRMERRPGREWPSRRLIGPRLEPVPASAGVRMTRRVTVVIGPYVGHPAVLYTAYGGPAAPREPDDPSLEGDPGALAEAQAFWSEHALVW